MDVCESIKAALAERGWVANLKRLDPFTGDEGIIVRRGLPESAGRYMDASRSVNFIARIFVRYRSERTAMETCDAIADYLIDRPLPSLDGSYLWSATEIYTEPQELVLDDGGFYVWETSVAVTIER